MVAPPDGANLSRVESYQYPSGHVGHITPNQQDVLKRFKDLCAAQNYYTPATESSPASHDDETLLRYLRARKFLPQDAFAQFKDTEDWRKENQIDTLYETIDVSEYEQTRRLYPQWLGRRDKRGIPVYLFEIAHLDTKAVTANAKSTEKKGQAATSKVPPKMLRLFALYENLCQFVLPLCSTVQDRAYPETPVSQSNNIVDISNVGLRQFWNLKDHMQDASVLATAHYPETLDRIFLIGAPSFFPTVWSWVKRWFDPITVSKIFILSAAEVKPTLMQYIDEENIPKKYGGKLDFNFGDRPMLEPAIADNFIWKDETRAAGFRTFPAGPIKWIKTADGKMTAVAVGTENGAKRNIPLAEVRPAEETAPSSGLKPPRAELMRTTTGEATHPPSPPPGAADVNPDEEGAAEVHSDEQTEAPVSPAPVTQPAVVNGVAYNAAPVAGAAAVGSAAPATGAAPVDMMEPPGKVEPVSKAEPESNVEHENKPEPGTYNLPFRDSVGDRSVAPEVRQGTSSTRYEQQQSTHAADTLASGTPEVRHMGHGDKINVMEPGTVGQAPKEHPMPPQEEAPAPTVMDQAKDVANMAYSQAVNLPQTVMSAVGMGGKPEPGQPAEPAKKEDPAVEAMDDRKVEEFLRSANMTKSAKPGNQG